MNFQRGRRPEELEIQSDSDDRCAVGNPLSFLMITTTYSKYAGLGDQSAPPRGATAAEQPNEISVVVSVLGRRHGQ